LGPLIVQPFWDVFWSDAASLAVFVTPMLGLALPASMLGARVGAAVATDRQKGAWRPAMWRGTAVGVAAALVISMLLEFSLKAEGLPTGRTALREMASVELCLAAPLIAVAAGFLVARGYTPPADAQKKHRYTLRQLFVAQLVIGLLLGWWAYTRRDEIGQRRHQLVWQARDGQLKSAFEPLGWNLQTWPDDDAVWLNEHGISPPVVPGLLHPLRLFPTVWELRIDSNRIVDRDVEDLLPLSTLRSLQLLCPHLTDDGVAQLCELPRLRYLRIKSPHITGATLEMLVNMKTLRFVEIDSAQITVADAEEFRQARPNVDLRINGM